MSYLQKYIAEGIIPFGLRIKLFPHIKNPTIEFKNLWEQTLTSCSLALMTLLINEYKSELASVHKELQDTSVSLASFTSVEDFTNKDKQIGKNLAKLSKQLITIKEKKLIRNRRAFSEHKAYAWPNAQSSKPLNRRFSNKSSDSSGH